MIIKNRAGREFLVRVVFKGDRYGLNDCLVHDENDPLVEFYDFSHSGAAFGPRGQFVSRYYASTLAEHVGGLDLLGYEPAWKIDADAVQPVLTTARALKRQFGVAHDIDAAFASLVRKASSDGVKA